MLPLKKEPSAPILAAIAIHPPFSADDKVIPMIAAGLASSPVIIN